LGLFCWSLILLSLYEWSSYVLQQFPYSRPWGEELNSYLLSLLGYFITAIVGALPGLSIVVVIVFMARGVIGLLKALMLRLTLPGTIRWLTPETLAPTNRLISLGIWLFALAMAYPYLPGAGTEAFKGLSVMLGLMISLGASNVVGQAAAGLILTYSGTIKPGEYIKVGDNEGTVIEMGSFTTRIMTGLGETLTSPNTMITSSVTRNYSRIVQGGGYLVDTTVTIGYDTPWRQVEALLLEACRRTEGVVTEPAPQVFQTALSDFYPEYRLVAQAVPSEPRSRAQLMSMLLANIQDVFNEYGVQIMSPHYITDPAEAKLVTRENWYAAPAQSPAAHDQSVAASTEAKSKPA
ncbi:MAG: mechanosensitive ion channel family protein, partial [Aeromonadaceae bacterium]